MDRKSYLMIPLSYHLKRSFNSYSLLYEIIFFWNNQFCFLSSPKVMLYISYLILMTICHSFGLHQISHYLYRNFQLDFLIWFSSFFMLIWLHNHLLIINKNISLFFQTILNFLIFFLFKIFHQQKFKQKSISILTNFLIDLFKQ